MMRINETMHEGHPPPSYDITSGRPVASISSLVSFIGTIKTGMAMVGLCRESTTSPPPAATCCSSWKRRAQSPACPSCSSRSCFCCRATAACPSRPSPSVRPPAMCWPQTCSACSHRWASIHRWTRLKARWPAPQSLVS